MAYPGTPQTRRRARERLARRARYDPAALRRALAGTDHACHLPGQLYSRHEGLAFLCGMAPAPPLPRGLGPTAASFERRRAEIKSVQLGDIVGIRIEDLRRKAEQGSQQLQGEVQELALEALLRRKFPRDLLEPVPKGEFGGDLVQRMSSGQVTCSSTPTMRDRAACLSLI